MTRIVGIVLAMLALGIVGLFPEHEKLADYNEKMAAAQLATQAFATLGDMRRQSRFTIDPELDPAETGLIGVFLSPITSNTGSLRAKQTSINPNLAAVVVHWLKKLHLRAGDTVAVGATGSFPALNIAAYAAIEVLHLRPIIITSTAASQWGANIPEHTWLDMERELYTHHIFSFTSVAASRGGVGDRGLGLAKDGREYLDQAVLRNNVLLIKPKSIEHSIQERMRVYANYAADSPIKAYINIGGGTVSVGTRAIKKTFRFGINRHIPHAAAPFPSMVGEFIKQGIPVVHLSRTIAIAQRFGLPVAPTKTPTLGQGDIFIHNQPRRWLAASVLMLLYAGLWWMWRRPAYRSVLPRHHFADVAKT